MSRSDDADHIERTREQKLQSLLRKDVSEEIKRVARNELEAIQEGSS